MANLTKLEFVALDISGKNYLSWILDARIHLDAMNLGETIKENNTTSQQDRAKAMIFIRRHIYEGLKSEYITVTDPLVLWKNLKDSYDHQKTVILPTARNDWLHLRLQDFKTVSEYNSAMFKITSQLNLCGENVGDKEMLEKTYLTFHASNVVLQQQYRERGFTKYSELISCLLVAEQNNELLMRNHQSRPTSSTPFPEANGTGFVPFPEANGTNFTSFPEANAEKFNGRGRGRGRYRGRGNGRGHGRNNSSYRGGHNGNSSSSKKNHGVGKQEIMGGPNPQDKPSKGSENLCYR